MECFRISRLANFLSGQDLKHDFGIAALWKWLNFVESALNVKYCIKFAEAVCKLSVFAAAVNHYLPALKNSLFKAKFSIARTWLKSLHLWFFWFCFLKKCNNRVVWVLCIKFEKKAESWSNWTNSWVTRYLTYKGVELSNVKTWQ